MRSPCAHAIGLLGLGLALCPPVTARPIRCADGAQGPCTVADSFDLAWPEGQPRWAAMLNFGLVTGRDGPDGRSLICEEAYGRRTPERILADDAGWLHLPGTGGVRRSRASDGCAWPLAAGIPATAVALSLAPAGTRPPGAPPHLFALVSEGTVQTLYRSTDGGARYVPGYRFPSTLQLWRVHTRPGDASLVLATGFGRQPGVFALARSRDGGVTFDVLDPVPAFPESDRITVLVGLGPGDPGALYFARSTREGGEELWRSDDAGATARPILTLQGNQVVMGFHLAADGRTLHVAGTELLERESVAPAHLYRSRDGGLTWEAPIPSGPGGPRYRCLTARAGTLYACAGGRDARDEFLLGASTDEGRTWTPLLTLETLPPPRPCIAAQCPETAAWLCESYAICPRHDAGCGCTIGRAPGPHGESLSPGALLLVLTVAAGLRPRRRRRPPSTR